LLTLRYKAAEHIDGLLLSHECARNGDATGSRQVPRVRLRCINYDRGVERAIGMSDELEEGPA